MINFEYSAARRLGNRHHLRTAILFTCAIVVSALVTLPANATDINFVQPASLDQPRINFALRDENGKLLTPGLGLIGMQAPFDTGASGVLVLKTWADFFEIPVQSGVVFSDVGVGGPEPFNVSRPVTLSVQTLPGTDPGNIASYNHTIGPIRLQLAQAPSDLDGLISGVVGMPAFKGRVVVMDPTPVDTVANPSFDLMRTFVYSPGTPFNPAAMETNPGIPVVDRHVQLSYASFDRFTTTTPAGASPPTLEYNPFIGPNPLRQIDPSLPADSTPGVKLTMGAASTTGSFLLDTGAAASMISIAKAGELNVRYRSGTLGTDNPILEFTNGQAVPNQFSLSLSGVGGAVKRAGFYIDSLLVRTEQGNVANDADPNHLRYGSAPLLVSDISLQDPNTNQTMTLDGIFGMNMLVASANTSGTDLTNLSIDSLTDGQFRWIVFDEPNKRLGLSIKPERLGPAFQWARTGGGSWNADASWDLLSVPDASPAQSQAVVVFGASITADATVNLATDRTVKIAKFSHADGNSYTLASTGGQLILKSDTGPAGLFLDAFNTESHTITAPIVLQSDVDVFIVANPADRLNLLGGQQWDDGVHVHLKALPIDPAAQSSTLRYNLDSADVVSVGIDNHLLVDAGTKLQLAGSKSALSDGVDHVDLTNHGILEVLGTNQAAGDLFGTGSTIIAAGASLTVDSIRQSSLTIGAGGILILRPSGSSGTLQSLGAGSYVDGTDSQLPITVPEPSGMVLACVATMLTITLRRLFAH